MRSAKWCGVAVAMLALSASADAQIIRPGFVPTTGARARAAAATRAGYIGTVPAYGGYAPIGGYAGYYQSPIEGYLNGVANVTTANAQYNVTIQEARLARERSRQAQLETRRAALEQLDYERSRRPSAEKWRLERQEQDLQRAMNFPPLSEVWSGQSLNALLRAVQKAQYHDVYGPSVPLRDEILKEINLTDGTTKGSTGTLRSQKPQWPFALQGTNFAKDRQAIDTLFDEAARGAASSGSVAPEVLRSLQSAVRGLDSDIDSSVKSMTPDDWVGSKRFVRELKETVQTLQSPNVSKYLGGKWQAKGPTVRDLVKQMTDEGLTFAPASEGGRSAYTVLQHAMVKYTTGIERVAGVTPKP